VVLGFAATLWAALRRAEGEVGWLTVAATASGLIMVSLGIGGGYWSMAVFRVEDGLDPQVARTLFDLGNFTFANTWVALAGLAFAVGLAALFRNAFPRWLGWASLVLSAALLIARAAWTTPVAFVPYMLFWLWLIVLSVILYRRAPGATKITG
jgi:hypothetical protein